jgi:hypothetical protein
VAACEGGAAAAAGEDGARLLRGDAIEKVTTGHMQQCQPVTLSRREF